VIRKLTVGQKVNRPERVSRYNNIIPHRLTSVL